MASYQPLDPQDSGNNSRQRSESLKQLNLRDASLPSMPLKVAANSLLTVEPQAGQQQRFKIKLNALPKITIKAKKTEVESDLYDFKSAENVKSTKSTKLDN